MRWVVSAGFAAAVVAAAAVGSAPPPASTMAAPNSVRADDTGAAADAEGERVTVMARNLYLGADVGVALDLLPDLADAAQFMWGQVTATDFGTRSALLAQEAHQFRPAVIGLQEATRWLCTSSFFDSPVAIYDFTAQFLDATSAAGTPYVIAEAEGRRAQNPGYRIGPLPGLTVTDPATFQPIFGQDSANCGFEIGDALLVRADLAGSVRRAGTSEYVDREVIVPTVLSIDRGFAWADIDVAGTTVRFVTTHLESLWDPDSVPTAAKQARQLVEDLSATTGPLIVMGDFNSDPRDPRPPGAANPASQPESSGTCPAQAAEMTVQSADGECSPYWTMRKAGYVSAGPDDFDPAYYSYGASALLAGPDPVRLQDALQMGNPSGFTDRLDYIFVRNGVSPDSGELVGSVWPNGPRIWKCGSAEQRANTAAAGEVLAAAGGQAPETDEGLCLPSDHAGVVVTVLVDSSGSVADDPPPTEHDPFRLVWWHVLLVVAVLLALLVRWRIRRRRRRRTREAVQTT